MSYNLTNVLAKRPTKEVYRDGENTIKLFVENYSKANILNEALIQARVEEGTDLNIPKLNEVTKIDGRWALVSDYVEGTTLEQLMIDHPDKIDEYLDLFVSIQMEMLSKKVPLLNRIKEKYKSRIEKAEGLTDNTRYELLERLDGMRDHTKLCHGDFVPSNIIIKDNGAHFIIDWSHATQGNGSADAATTYLKLTRAGKEELAEKYLDLYCEKTDTAKILVQRWIPIVAAVELTRGNAEDEEFLKKWVDVVDYN